MSVYQVILGSGWIALAVWMAARSATSLRLGRSRPGMTKPGSRVRQWRLIGSSLTCCLLGIVFVTNSLHSDATRWLLAASGTALLIWFVTSDVGSWSRSRRQRKSAQRQA